MTDASHPSSSTRSPTRRRRRPGWLVGIYVFLFGTVVTVSGLAILDWDRVLDDVPYGLLLLGTGSWLVALLVVVIDTVLNVCDARTAARARHPRS